MTSFEQVPDSDNVIITVVADAPESAQDIAQAYAEVYLEQAEAKLVANEQAKVVDLDARIAQLQADLDAVNEQIRLAIKPFLDAFNSATARGAQTQPVPDPRLVDPAGSVLQDQIQTELIQLKTLRNDLEFEQGRAVTSSIVQSAPLPTLPEPLSVGLYRTVGIVLGVLLGVIIALLSAQFSTKVLDTVAVAEILRSPVTARVPRVRKVGSQPRTVFGELPSLFVPPIEGLCVRAEGMAPLDRAILVAVAGTQRRAGSTTLALAMAGHFGSHGYEVIVIDADPRNPYISGSFLDGRRIATRGQSDDVAAEFEQRLISTPIPTVRVLALAGRGTNTAIRRESLASLVATAQRRADVVIFDVGSVPNSPIIAHVAELVDSIVLAVPLSKQRIEGLEDVHRRLGPGAIPKLVPVVTSPGRRAAPITQPSFEPERAAGRSPADDEPVPSTDSREPKPAGRERPEPQLDAKDDAVRSETESETDSEVGAGAETEVVPWTDPDVPRRPSGSRPEPARREPAKAGAVRSGSDGRREPSRSEPARSEPVKSEPAKSEPAKSEPAKSEPAKAGAVKSESGSDGRPEPAKTGAAKTESGSAKTQGDSGRDGPVGHKVRRSS